MVVFVERHTCLHVGETLPVGERETIDKTTHEATYDKNNICPASIDVEQQISLQACSMVTFSFGIRGFVDGSIGDTTQRIGKAKLVLYIIGFRGDFSNSGRIIKSALIGGFAMKDQALCELEHGVSC